MDKVRKDFEKLLKQFPYDLYYSDMLGYRNSTTASMFMVYRAAHDSQQAIIDRLMLEFCPEEMTVGQVEEWKNSQRIAPE